MSRLFGILCCVLFLNGCSSLSNDETSDAESAQDSEELSFDDSAFDDSDDEEIKNEPKDLESIDDATVKIKKVWRQSIGSMFINRHCIRR